MGTLCGTVTGRHIGLARLARGTHFLAAFTAMGTIIGIDFCFPEGRTFNGFQVTIRTVLYDNQGFGKWISRALAIKAAVTSLVDSRPLLGSFERSFVVQNKRINGDSALFDGSSVRIFFQGTHRA
jgi:hypothetical protein